jgi:exonuclease VII small subunit
VGLEEALELFESGMQLARSCRERLEEVEQRVARLLDSDADQGHATEELEVESS